MKKMMQNKLEFLRKFQKKNPTSHVGGSIGLMLQNVNLGRDLNLADLDITIDEIEYNFFKEFNANFGENINGTSDTTDFQVRFNVRHNTGFFTKVEIRLSPEPSFDVIEFEGNSYNVSKIRNILFWKKKYANQRSEKHLLDLWFIHSGSRERLGKEYVQFREDLFKNVVAPIGKIYDNFHGGFETKVRTIYQYINELPF